jgi:hypothetical protein
LGFMELRELERDRKGFLEKRMDGWWERRRMKKRREGVERREGGRRVEAGRLLA